jgi:HAD superfamily hydrolase (TIGR01549 family)
MGQAAEVLVPRWVCLDIGEVLIDETRIWSTWADVLGIPRFTFLAALGGAVARGGDHREAFALLGIDDWQDREAQVQAAYGGFRSADLYPDALPALAALRAGGFRVAVVGNQPARRRGELLALGVEVDVLAMSEELGVEKPDPAFFTRVLALCGDAEPSHLAYVGDRVDNDVAPAAAAGLRAVWLRRGPWGVLQRDDAGTAALVVTALDELVVRLPALLGGW